MATVGPTLAPIAGLFPAQSRMIATASGTTVTPSALLEGGVAHSSPGEEVVEEEFETGTEAEPDSTTTMTIMTMISMTTTTMMIADVMMVRGDATMMMMMTSMTIMTTTTTVEELEREQGAVPGTLHGGEQLQGEQGTGTGERPVLEGTETGIGKMMAMAQKT